MPKKTARKQASYSAPCEPSVRRLCAMVFFLFLFSLSSLGALDFLLRAKAFVFLPLGPASLTPFGTPRFQIGGGAEIGFEVDLSSIWSNRIGLGYTVGLEAGLTSNTPSITGGTLQNVTFYTFAADIGAYFFPVSRLFLRLDAAGGIFIPTSGGENGPVGIYYRAGTEVGFRFSPVLLLSANIGWKQYGIKGIGNQQTWNSGISAGLTIQYTIETGTSSADGAEVSLVQDTPVYPAFLQLYQSNPVGTLIITNRENAEMRNVRVSFRAGNYTSSEFLCGTSSLIPKGRSAEIPLFADFSNEILRLTDDGRILGEIVVRYNFLGQERSSVSAVTLSSYNRNTIIEGDLTMLGAFISPTSPEVNEYSRYVVGLARSRSRTGHNQNMQFAAWLLEGLRAYGIRTTEAYAYKGEVQFPAETLVFRTGTGRDLALLYAASLESVGITSGLINIGDEYIVAVNLGITPAAAETLFYNSDWILNINEQIWLPLSMSYFNGGFMESWAGAVYALNYAFAGGEYVDFIVTGDAWYSYPPAPMPELGVRLAHIESELIVSSADSALNQYIEQEIFPLIYMVDAQIRQTPTAALYNRMGILLARAGQFADAVINYERAAGMGSVAAMTNRANLAMNERDYDTAEYWFFRALELDRGNATALRGLDRIESRR